MFKVASAGSRKRSSPDLWPALTAIVSSLVLLAAGCDRDDPAVFQRPRLTGMTYVSIRADPADPTSGHVELTNVGKTPLTGLHVRAGRPSRDVPPIDAHVTLAPSETRDLGRIKLDGETDLQIWSMQEYFPQFFRVSRRADGLMAASNDPAFDEYFMRHGFEEARTAKRWGLFFTALKVVGVTVGVLAVIAVIVSVRRAKRGQPK